MKSDSNDVKQLTSQVIELVARLGPLEDSIAKIWLPVLVNGSKEKNSAVKANSEYALITLLRLREDDSLYKVNLTLPSIISPLSFFYSSAWSSYTTDLLSLRLFGAVAARDYVRSSFSQWALSLTNRTLTLDLSILSLAL